MRQMSESKNTDDSPDYWISHEKVSQWHDQIQEDLRECMTPKYSITRLFPETDEKPTCDTSSTDTTYTAPPGIKIIDRETKPVVSIDNKIAGIENTLAAMRQRIERLERHLARHIVSDMGGK